MPALSGGMIRYRRRSAKSVACSRLNVIGVSEFFFFPVFVAALTSADEFHSVTNTRCPLAVSHLASRPSCVVFPDPSMPSTTNSRPGYVCGVASVVSIRGRVLMRRGGTSGRGEFETNRRAQQGGERGSVSIGGPDLQLRIPLRVQPDAKAFVVLPDVEPGNYLRVAAVEPLGQPHDRAEQPHDTARGSRQIAKAVVGLL